MSFTLEAQDLITALSAENKRLNRRIEELEAALMRRLRSTSFQTKNLGFDSFHDGTFLLRHELRKTGEK